MNHIIQFAENYRAKKEGILLKFQHLQEDEWVTVASDERFVREDGLFRNIFEGKNVKEYFYFEAPEQIVLRAHVEQYKLFFCAQNYNGDWEKHLLISPI